MEVRNNGPGGAERWYPYKIEAQLRAAEMRYIRLMQQCVKEELPAVYAAYRAEQQQNLRLDSMADFRETVRRAFARAKRKFRRRIDEEYEAYEGNIEKVSRNALAFSLLLWGQMVRETLGKTINKAYFRGAAYDTAAKLWSAESAAKTADFAEQVIDKMAQVVQQDYQDGKDTKQLVKDLQRRYDVAKNRIVTAAGDQTGTLNAQIRRMQFLAIGTEWYIWSSSHDERVRPCHAELDGKLFRYSEPPEMWYMTKRGKVYTGRHCNPGEDYNCRCVALLPKAVKDLNPAAFEAAVREEAGRRGFAQWNAGFENKPVTDAAIAQVKVPKMAGFDEKQRRALETECKNLLEYARNLPLGTEAGRCYTMDMKPLGGFVPGSTGKVKLQDYAAPYIAIHNHPSGLTFSPKDIWQFVGDSNMVALVAVGNEGSVYIMEKGNNFNAIRAAKEAGAAIDKIEQTTNKAQVIQILRNFFKGAADYGLYYHS